MISATALIACAFILGAITFGFRAAGPVLHARTELSARTKDLMSTGATVLLVALCATAAVADGKEWSDPARPAGVAVAALLAWRRAPFIVVVVAAAATAALLRLIL